MTLEVLSTYKCSTVNQAKERSIPIRDENDVHIGDLIPVGRWVLNEPLIIDSLCKWRKTFNRMFLSQSTPSVESTFNYLKYNAISKSDKLLFLICDTDLTVVGHIGVANATQTQMELDNLLRGRAGLHPRLVYFAERAILQWMFFNLGIKRCVLGILSFNWMAQELHEQIGFEVTNNAYLFKEQDEFGVKHRFCGISESNVNYSYMQMTLELTSFK